MNIPALAACSNPSPLPTGFAPPCPVWSPSASSVPQSGSLTLSATPQAGTDYILTTAYISQGTTWNPYTLSGNNAVPSYSSSLASLTLSSTQLQALSLGTHYAVSWDWLWDATSQCYKGPGLNQCNTGQWRVQSFSITSTYAYSQSSYYVYSQSSYYAYSQSTYYTYSQSAYVSGSTPYTGTPYPIPGKIEAENYDLGGQNVAYYDTTPGNAGGQYRADDVDIESTTDTGGGYDVAYTAAGEWLNYTVNVQSTGSYTLTVRVASGGQGGTFHVMLDSTNISGTLTIPDTGGWQIYTTLTQTVSLSSGQHILKIVEDAIGPSGNVGNFNWMQFASGTSPTPTPTPTPTPNLLFKSGFEANTVLNPVPSSQVGPNAYFQTLSGTDTGTGFSWPPSAFNAASTNAIHIEPAVGDTSLVLNHFTNSIDTAQHHSGTNSLFLSVHDYTDGSCCAQQPYQMSDMTPPMTEMYERYWMLLPSAYATQVSGYGSTFRMISEFKSVGDYRTQLSINKGACAIGNCPVSGSTDLHPTMHSDTLGQNTSFNCPYADPITGSTVANCNIYINGPYQYNNANNLAITIPIGTWFEVEYYIRRSTGPDGRFFAAINGRTVFDWSGPTYGVNQDAIQDMYYINQYSDKFPMQQWIDDWEIWDKPPCTTLPCGTITGAGGGYAGAVPPSINSYRGTIGAVGAAFNYQIKAAFNPTSYAINTGSLPSGLSLNTSTGLISGTPTAAGTNTVTILATNGAGNGTEPLEFQINSAVQAPIIHDLWATPSTVSSGSPSTLSWNVLGAGTVTLSINQGVGTVTGMSGSKVVNPSTTTTYTLTATNSAGSVSKSVTVTVS